MRELPFGAASVFHRDSGAQAARVGTFVRKETSLNDFLQKFEKTVDKRATFVYYISRRRARHKKAMRRCQPGSIAQLGEHLPYKQRVTGSSPVVPTMLFASVAQSVEQRTENPRVDGSIPSGGTNFMRV